MSEGDTQSSSVRTTKHGKIMVGELPSDFLQVSSSNSQLARDEQMAHQLATQQVQRQMMQPTVTVSDRLLISVVEAKLNKNYGIVKMDPYCRLRVGHNVYETDTAYGGAKNPRWTKSISVPFLPEIEMIYLEIFDERSMSTDCRIAWREIVLPSKVKNGEPADEWWPLTGKLGEEMEGTVHLLISKKKVQQTVNRPMPVMIQPGYAPMAAPMAAPYAQNPYYVQAPGSSAHFQPNPHQPGATPVQSGPMFTDEDVKQLKELFPNVEDDVIKAVLEASRGNKDAAINSLLSMQ